MELLGPNITNTDLYNFNRMYGVTSRWDSLRASWMLSNMGTADAYLDNMSENEAITEDILMSPEVLNRKYPNLQIPFSKPTGLKLANLIAQRQNKQRTLQSIINSGPTDTTQTVLNFATNIAAHATDKWEFAAGVAGSLAVGLLTGGVGAGAGLGGLAARAGISFGGALLGNALIEPWLMYGAHNNQEEYTVQDAATSVIGGALLGTVIDVGGRAGLDLIGHLKKGSFPDNFKKAVAQAESNMIVDVETKTRYIIPPELPTKYFNVEMNYSHANLSLGRNGNLAKGFKLYAPSNLKASNKISIGSHTLGDGLFEGRFHVVDNPRAAAFNILESKSNGHLFEVTADGVKLFDMQYQVKSHGKLGKKIQDLIEAKIGEKFDPAEVKVQELFEKLSIKDKLEVEDKVEALLKAEGYDGLNYKSFVEDTPSNRVVLFNKKKLKEVGQVYVDKGQFMMDEAEIKRIQENITQPISEQYYEVTSRPEFESRSPELKQDTPDIDPERIINDIDQRYDFPENSEAAKDIKTMKQNIKDADNIMRDAVTCVE